MNVTDEQLQEIAQGMVDEAYRDLIHERMGQLETLEGKLEGYEDISNDEADALAERLEAILKAEYDERLARRADSSDDDDHANIAEAKVVLYHVNGTTDEFNLHTVTGCHLLVEGGIEEVDPTPDGWRQFRGTGVADMHFELHGKGAVTRKAPPASVSSVSEPMPAKPEETA